MQDSANANSPAAPSSRSPLIRRAVLGIDAAWTSTEPSGVALVFEDNFGGWRCVALAPSYASFMLDAVDWTQVQVSSAPNPAALVTAARLRLPGQFELSTAVDMPLASVPISGRRRADNAVSDRFGAAGCGTHTPSATRPGPIGEALSSGFISSGLRLAVVGTDHASGPHLLEVFPHPAMLTLLGEGYRVPYKVGKAGRYWPGASVQKRIELLLGQFERILNALSVEIGDIALQLPVPSRVKTLSELKRYEDALDALVCAWVGTEFLRGNAEAFGDGTAVIWVPRSS